MDGLRPTRRELLIATGVADRIYWLFCGNWNCGDREVRPTHAVPASAIPDGELWLCDA